MFLNCTNIFQKIFKKNRFFIEKNKTINHATLKEQRLLMNLPAGTDGNERQKCLLRSYRQTP